MWRDKRLWGLVALSGVLFACTRPRKKDDVIEELPAGETEPEEKPAELFVFAHDRELIPDALEAARRIETASGIKVHVNAYGTQTTALPIFGSDFLCGSGTEGRSAAYGIAIARDCKHEPVKILIHEMMHQLGVGHLELPERGIMNHAKDDPLDKITEADLTALCAVRDCPKFQPEA